MAKKRKGKRKSSKSSGKPGGDWGESKITSSWGFSKGLDKRMGKVKF